MPPFFSVNRVKPCEPAAATGVRDSFSAAALDKGHGRIEKRVLTASSDLNDYLDWPHVQQVFRLERRFEYVNQGKTTCETVYGITSLRLDQAAPSVCWKLYGPIGTLRMACTTAGDETLREDWCHLRLGHTQRMMAAVNNLVLGLLLRRGVRNVPRQRRWYAARWNEALKLITSV